ncbi:MerR family transcriptional regulator [Eleftheria terrae]|uniref:MerR family transcriptional regulator n=1 Tax=Eleftheria terrae TaxID=1597781 RepID=UPI00263A4635|nr:MerR family transcriptional regulator [Eleftheria terrae]WKB53062.1 MerR family transcriptional regulator [Eleftheria terrae]
MEKALPAIPAKRYFTIGEVSELCGVKPYVLRYWEQEFTQLKPMKRRGNRRYYQHHEVLLIRRIRELLYEQGFTISGARNRLAEMGQHAKAEPAVPLVVEAAAESPPTELAGVEVIEVTAMADTAVELAEVAAEPAAPYSISQVRQELLSIRMLLAI